MSKQKQDTLVKECRLAAAAGLSYGQWKAQQLVVPPPKAAVPKKLLPEVWRTCEICGEAFLQHDNRARRYCKTCGPIVAKQKKIANRVLDNAKRKKARAEAAAAAKATAQIFAVV